MGLRSQSYQVDMRSPSRQSDLRSHSHQPDLRAFSYQPDSHSPLLTPREPGSAEHSARSSAGGGVGDLMHCGGIISMDYASSLKSLALVYGDGRCAVCRTPDGGLQPAEGIQISHFLCRPGSGAVCARIGARAPPDAQGFRV